MRSSGNAGDDSEFAACIKADGPPTGAIVFGDGVLSSVKSGKGLSGPIGKGIDARIASSGVRFGPRYTRSLNIEGI